MGIGEKRVLSEDTTFLFRWFIPAFQGIIGLFLILAGLYSAGVIVLAFVAANYSFNFLRELRFCRVSIEGDALLISKFSRQVRVPLLWIVDVHANHRHWISIVFDRDIGLGTRIKFIPFTRLVGFDQEHPFVTELRQLAGLSK